MASNLAPQDLENLQLRAVRYALAHGLLYLPPGTQAAIPMSAIHAPIALFPTPFPRAQFERAKSLQSTYNTLYARIALDTWFLDEVMGTERGVGKVDDFVGKLWTGWKALRDEGLHQVRFIVSISDLCSHMVRPLHLGLFRSDYLLHVSEDNNVSIRQVEFNTISSSFGTLSQKVSEMHRHLCASTGFYESSPYLQALNLPPNNTIAGLVEGLAAAHTVYDVPSSQILFVVQPGERNVFDQLWLEYELLEKHSIKVIRLTLDELSSCSSVSSINAPLFITPLSTRGVIPIEISTIYFRAAYTPTDFPTPSHYTTRFTLEKSKAIKCPSIPLQLAGGKKVQQVLTQPGVLERFLSDEAHWGLGSSSPPEVISELRASWMGMWGLDVGGDDGVNRAREHAMNLVLKPQREGGGNNVYKEAVPAFLDSLPLEERQAWIAMELIAPPKGMKNYLIRAGGGESLVEMEVMSELGIFGWALFGDGVGESEGKVREKEVGWLVRTKGKDSNEGGVATGFSVLDSLVLVD
ncbi:hypothetical protein D9758_011332 [Tetrapyrgos nigripes]|uniref:Glutathione synthetase n=1 Tax=Tetrapyrgos nigripes TaxID=182062 RepID=A0A8H5G882_9AGAR|nr:hypothetical protein D9758_011332 [Tetrapyrgos nigripes]